MKDIIFLAFFGWDEFVRNLTSVNLTYCGC